MTHREKRLEKYFCDKCGVPIVYVLSVWLNGKCYCSPCLILNHLNEGNREEWVEISVRNLMFWIVDTKARALIEGKTNG